MARINLLPWREELRKQKQQEFGVTAISSVVIAGLIVLLAHFHVNGLIENQDQRNVYLEGEIEVLNKRIGLRENYVRGRRTRAGNRDAHRAEAQGDGGRKRNGFNRGLFQRGDFDAIRCPGGHAKRARVNDRGFDFARDRVERNRDTDRDTDADGGTKCHGNRDSTGHRIDQ